MSKKDKRFFDWITIGSDTKRIREQWETSSKSNLPLLIVGETGTGKSFWVKESFKIRGLEPKQIINLDFDQNLNLETLLNQKSNSKKIGYCISNITKIQPDQILLLLQWWKNQKYTEQTSHYLYWEINSNEIITFESSEKLMDLYNQLKSFRFELPPLRKRLSDLPVFINYFIEEASFVLNKKVKNIEDDFYGFFKNKLFRNNLSELRDFLFAIVGFSNGKTLHWKQIPLHFFQNETNDLNVRPGIKMEEYEKEIIKANLLFTKGNREKTAKLLGISERNLYRKIHEFQLEDFS